MRSISEYITGEVVVQLHVVLWYSYLHIQCLLISCHTMQITNHQTVVKPSGSTLYVVKQGVTGHGVHFL